MKTTGAACVSEDLCRLLKKKKTNREFRRFSYRARTRPFGYFKHVNS